MRQDAVFVALKKNVMYEPDAHTNCGPTCAEEDAINKPGVVVANVVFIAKLVLVTVFGAFVEVVAALKVTPKEVRGAPV